MEKFIKKGKKGKRIIFIISVGFLLLVSYLIGVSLENSGEYDYCVEWEGMNSGTLHRDSLLFTCYNLAQDIFYCDYNIDEQTQILEVKPIVNTTYNEDGGIIGLEYDEPNYFNCTRWLKSKYLNNKND